MNFIIIYQSSEANTFGISISDTKINLDIAKRYTQAYIRICYYPKIHSFISFSEPLTIEKTESVVYISKLLERKLKSKLNKAEAVLNSINLILSQNG